MLRKIIIMIVIFFLAFLYLFCQEPESISPPQFKGKLLIYFMGEEAGYEEYEWIEQQDKFVLSVKGEMNKPISLITSQMIIEVNKEFKPLRFYFKGIVNGINQEIETTVTQGEVKNRVKAAQQERELISKISPEALFLPNGIFSPYIVVAKKVKGALEKEVTLSAYVVPQLEITLNVGPDRENAHLLHLNLAGVKIELLTDEKGNLNFLLIPSQSFEVYEEKWKKEIEKKEEPEKAEEKKAEALPASLSGFSDEGVFRLYVNEDPLVEINFKWEKEGKFSNTSTLSMAGQSVTTVTEIETDEEGRWIKIIQNTPQGIMELVREGSIVTRTFKEKTVTIELKDGAVLFENFSPALMSQSVRAYDKNKGGKQTISLFIIPGAMMEASLEMKEEVERTIAGKDIKFTKFLYGIPGVDITLWVDDKDRLYLADVPSQNAAYVREGFEILLQKPETDPLLSTPKYEIIEEFNLEIPMRDGINLATNIYRPDAEGKFPVILARTPYKKEMVELQARYYARRGYIFAVQDCRGRFSSSGIWEPFVNEPQDGYDTIEWLAAQPWSNGKVGMIGGSYVGWVQWWAARERPPHLVTIIPNVSPPDPFYNIPYEYGVFFILGAIWWADILESEATADLSGVAMSQISEKKYHKLLRSLPVIDLDKKILGKENPYWRKWIEHPTNDQYWESANFLDRLKNVRIPVFHQSGWFDGDGIGSKLNYARMKSYGHPYQKLILGPWGHTDRAMRRIGDLDFGPQAIVDLQRDYLRWFDYWLKGIDNGITKEPLVSIFVMGSNKWLQGNEYPLPYTQFQKWYLWSNGKANTSKGDGLLSPSPPPEDLPYDSYIYDPGDPTPSPNFYEEEEEEEKKVKSVEEKKKEAEAYHEKITQSRSDILVYQTKPLEKPLTFAGPISAVLYASTSAKDTDWFMRLVWVTKEGKTYPLVEGKIRARFHQSLNRPELLTPGKIYKYTLDLWQTGITIPAGDSLRVEIASASFPVFSRNLNTGGHNEKETHYEKAEQKIYHSKKYPSHIFIPVIPDEKIK